MNLKSFLSASVVCVVGLFGVAACSSTPDDDGEGETGESSQALCRRGMNCAPPGSGGYVVEPPTYPTFTCPTKVQVPCGPVLKCDAAGVCTCQNSCNGGGYGTSMYNPCPWYARNYTCTWYGACSCSP